MINYKARTPIKLERLKQQEFLRALYRDIYPNPLPVDSTGLTYLGLVVAGPPHNQSYQPKFLLKDQEVVSVRPLAQTQVISSGYSNRSRTGTTQRIQVDNQLQTPALSPPKTTTEVNIP